MANLKITCDRGSGKKGGSYQMNDYALESDGENLIFTLSTDNKTIRYRICPDDRNAEIDDITAFLQEQADAALDDGKCLSIRENPIRRYIHVGKRQFTAYRWEP